CTPGHKGKSTLKQDRRNELEWGGNWVRFQTDGAVKIDSSYATTGGVLKDENGEWLLGFNRCLGKWPIFYVELWDVLDGLTLLQGKQRDRVLIQTDSSGVFEAI
ncbi:hypothetical protein Gogos_006103, partial [Gossypium gossypioides]|nr:hypothetical protein [Gossypium gossypioides]